MNTAIWFLIGLGLGIIVKKYGVKIVWNLWKLFYTLYVSLYYRPKVRYYKKLIIKRGWKPCSIDGFSEWEHPQKGKAFFYNAVCLETGKNPRI
jgi:hypothetical protein